MTETQRLFQLKESTHQKVIGKSSFLSEQQQRNLGTSGGVVRQRAGLLQEAGVLLLLWTPGGGGGQVPASIPGHRAGTEHPRIHSPAACKGLPSNHLLLVWVCKG